jgi:hypothetical protein
MHCSFSLFVVGVCGLAFSISLLELVDLAS